jgi:ribosomally synthesized peptide (two-chain TOMM family)
MPNDPNDDRFFKTPPFTGLLGGASGSYPTPAEDPLQGLRGTLAWQYAWNQAIALAWSDDTLKADLIRDPRVFFKARMNYDLPEGLAFTVKEMDTADKNGNPSGWDPKINLWWLEKTELTMYIPPAPPLEQQAVALAAYCATARAYPFTMC